METYEGDGWVPVFHQLHSLHNLQYFNVCRCGLRDGDVKILADVMTKGNLVWLDLNDNDDKGDDGARYLTQALQNDQCRLRGLILEENDMTPNGSHALCAILQ